MSMDLEGQVKELKILSQVGLPYMIETWQGVIDPLVWTIALGGTTGTVLRDITEEPYQKVILTGPANDDEARLYTIQEYQLGPDTWGQNTFNKALVMEWECKFDTVAGIGSWYRLSGYRLSYLWSWHYTITPGLILTVATWRSPPLAAASCWT